MGSPLSAADSARCSSRPGFLMRNYGRGTPLADAARPHRLRRDRRRLRLAPLTVLVPIHVDPYGRSLMRSAPSSTAWEIGVLLATPPSMSVRSRPRTRAEGRRGWRSWPSTASSSGPRERRSSSPLITSTATTCSGIGICSSRRARRGDDQPPQAGIGDEVVAGAEEAEQPGERVEREDLPATQAAPDVRQGVRRRDGLRSLRR